MYTYIYTYMDVYIIEKVLSPMTWKDLILQLPFDSDPIVPQTGFSLMGFLPGVKELPKALTPSKLTILYLFGCLPF